MTMGLGMQTAMGVGGPSTASRTHALSLCGQGSALRLSAAGVHESVLFALLTSLHEQPGRISSGMIADKEQPV
jgi:hypothetical protein